MSVRTSAILLAVISTVSFVWLSISIFDDWTNGFVLGLCWALGLGVRFWMDFRRDQSLPAGSLKGELLIFVSFGLLLLVIGKAFDRIDLELKYILPLLLFMVSMTLYRNRIAEYHRIRKEGEFEN